ALGRGQVSPSPLVGCVVVDREGHVVGEGYYLYAGVKHAETIALAQAGEHARGGTAYVSLEPHAHHGRTPPCTDALIRAGVSRVVAPVEDPNPLVSGQGFAHLRATGVRVETGLLAAEADRLNEKYNHFLRTGGCPFVHLKLASSLDGRIATRTGDARWITGEAARRRTHELRHEYDAILVGAGTVAADDPLLTDRSALPRHRPLTRVVLDSQLRSLREDSQLVRTARETPLVVFAADEAPSERKAMLESFGVEVVGATKWRDSPRELLAALGRRGLQSLLIEGGSGVAALFLEADLVNKATFFFAPIIIGGRDAVPSVGGHGAATIADAIKLTDAEIIQHGDDYEITGYPKNRQD
ncbi:MAG TPA: bifunctional diaminohydroxyphosphoribosylaminopyrimidine deaminase/5-amino-6-(5-phosphoribosylamino)uracil reductase RibD, partial [Pyrinomonadaceae bacterium]|nr:bifunctional diaminohydroxyphosphoribosylaminopyrimidine deaminase/5-amino-6-(5-phosphoribosylamino)uracil reductase RibD [Pyrinomonadaceae bacterium]